MVLASGVNFALPSVRAFERHNYVSDSTPLTPENNPGYLKLSFWLQTAHQITTLSFKTRPTNCYATLDATSNDETWQNSVNTTEKDWAHNSSSLQGHNYNAWNEMNELSFLRLLLPALQRFSLDLKACLCIITPYMNNGQSQY